MSPNGLLDPRSGKRTLCTQRLGDLASAPIATRRHAVTTPPELEGFQRKYLRQLAHPSRPMVQVGEAGVTDAVRAAIDAALLDHELIKVRLRRPENKQKAAQDLAGGVGAALCGLVGHTVILYRPHPETPRIAVPERSSAAPS